MSELDNNPFLREMDRRLAEKAEFEETCRKLAGGSSVITADDIDRRRWRVLAHDYGSLAPAPEPEPDALSRLQGWGAIYARSLGALVFFVGLVCMSFGFTWVLAALGCCAAGSLMLIAGDGLGVSLAGVFVMVAQDD